MSERVIGGPFQPGQSGNPNGKSGNPNGRPKTKPRVIGRPFQPGQSGNPNGRPKTKPFKDALQKALKDSGDDSSALESVALALVTKAKEGDVPAIKELADRLDGKVAQAIIGGEEDDPAVTVTWLARS